MFPALHFYFLSLPFFFSHFFCGFLSRLKSFLPFSFEAHKFSVAVFPWSMDVYSKITPLAYVPSFKVNIVSQTPSFNVLRPTKHIFWNSRSHHMVQILIEFCLSVYISAIFHLTDLRKLVLNFFLNRFWQRILMGISYFCKLCLTDPYPVLVFKAQTMVRLIISWK